MYFALSLVFAFLTFYRLGQISIQNWDEARHGISAYEMLQSGNYIVNTYRYDADLWNLKPPLSFWMIAASLEALGYNVLALRIPSAICFVLMFGLITYHLHKRYGFVSTAAFMVLFVSYGDLFISHLGRSADADALYNLLFVGAVLALFRSNPDKRDVRWLYLSGFLASLAFLCKSFHAVAVYGIITAYVVPRKEFKSVSTYAKLATAAFLPILIWIIWRFSVDGFEFLGSMFGVDVVDRILEYEVEVQTKGATSLFHYLLYYRPSQVLLIIAAFSGSICIVSDGRIKKCSLHSLVHNQDAWLYGLWFIIPSLIFEAASATTTWYYYPSVIALIVIAAILLGKSVNAVIGLCAGGKRTVFYILIATLICEMGVMLVFSARSVVGTYRSIGAGEQSYEQATLTTLLSRESEYAGRHAFILKDTNSYRQPDEWEQCDVLAAELAADLMCYDGGIEGFVNDTESILLISKEQYQKNAVHVEKYSILCEDSHYLILAH